MKLLLFSDLHCSTGTAQNLVMLSRQVDLVVGAGDFATMRCGLQETIDTLAAIDCPAILVPGNAESHEELAAACRSWPSARVLHGTGVQIDGVSFWGVGGAIPVTPFGPWSHDLSEEDGRRLLADCPVGGVLVSHAPPQGAADQSGRGIRLGSVAIREAVQRCQPRLAVCGHVHDSWGQTDRIGESPIINAGPTGIVWEL